MGHEVLDAGSSSSVINLKREVRGLITNRSLDVISHQSENGGSDTLTVSPKPYLPPELAQGPDSTYMQMDHRDMLPGSRHHARSIREYLVLRYINRSDLIEADDQAHPHQSRKHLAHEYKR